MSLQKKITIPLIAFILGAGAGYWLHASLAKKAAVKTSFVERRAGQFRLVNPLLECDIADDVLKNQELKPFREKIEKAVAKRMDRQWAANVSVYFRELNDGLWFSIGDQLKFVPASLRKVPLMIALLKQAEEQKSNLLDRTVTFDLSGDYNEKQNIKPSKKMVPGRGYTVRDLIHRMIVYSDNNAFTLLTKVVDPLEFDRVYTLLRIQNPSAPEDDEFLSVQTYASFFRVLYNATYLTKEHSDWALDLLSQTEFRAGIVAGVPPDVIVSHKFGEHSDESGTVQLHDCGIVYYPQHPYMLCVMSRGPSFEFLDDVIAEVSRLTFSEVHSQHRGH